MRSENFQATLLAFEANSVESVVITLHRVARCHMYVRTPISWKADTGERRIELPPL